MGRVLRCRPAASTIKNAVLLGCFHAYSTQLRDTDQVSIFCISWSRSLQAGRSLAYINICAAYIGSCLPAGGMRMLCMALAQLLMTANVGWISNILLSIR